MSFDGGRKMFVKCKRWGRVRQWKLIKRNERRICFSRALCLRKQSSPPWAMFFGLIPHDRLNYAAIKMEKCPLRSFAGSWCFFPCDAECFRGKVKSSIAWKVEGFPSFPVGKVFLRGKIPIGYPQSSHSSRNSYITFNPIESNHANLWNEAQMKRRVCMAFLCFVILFSLLCFRR